MFQKTASRLSVIFLFALLLIPAYGVLEAQTYGTSGTGDPVVGTDPQPTGEFKPHGTMSQPGLFDEMRLVLSMLM